jgi:hypothetical protein
VTKFQNCAHLAVCVSRLASLRAVTFGLSSSARPGVASNGSKGENSLDAVTPGLTLGTLYCSGVDTNKTKQHAV